MILPAIASDKPDDMEHARVQRGVKVSLGYHSSPVIAAAPIAAYHVAPVTTYHHVAPVATVHHIAPVATYHHVAPFAYHHHHAPIVTKVKTTYVHHG